MLDLCAFILNQMEWKAFMKIHWPCLYYFPMWLHLLRFHIDFLVLSWLFNSVWKTFNVCHRVNVLSILLRILMDGKKKKSSSLFFYSMCMIFKSKTHLIYSGAFDQFVKYVDFWWLGREVEVGPYSAVLRAYSYLCSGIIPKWGSRHICGARDWTPVVGCMKNKWLIHSLWPMFYFV